MYTKDKTNRVTLRLNDDQFSFVRQNAELLGVSPSDFLRMVINLTMSQSAYFASQATEKAKEGEGLRRENEQTSVGDQL